MSKAYEEELRKKQEEVFHKAERLAKVNCKLCNGRGIRTWVVNNAKNAKQDIARLCRCVHKNLAKLEVIKDLEVIIDEECKKEGQWLLKDLVINVRKGEVIK